MYTDGEACRDKVFLGPDRIYTISFNETIKDKAGNPLPVSKHTKENIAADFIVTWNNVNTIMHYPEREGFDFPNEFNKNFGFRFDHEGNEAE